MHFCGASVIHPRFLLSAGSCLDDKYKLPHIRAVAGNHDLNGSAEKREMILHVIRLITQDSYNARTHDNDIALLELNEPLNFDDKYVRPVKLWISAWKLPRKQTQKQFQIIL